MSRQRIAVILFNLGGPDSLAAVKPFLFNLFSDPAIISLPGPFRRFLAGRLSARREALAQDIYRQIGGASPLLEETRAQARGLEKALAPVVEARCFPVMRYWHPLAGEVVREVSAFGAEKIVLLPLYPQFSTATTASSLADWRRAAGAAGLVGESRTICCYPDQPDFIRAHVGLINRALETLDATMPRRVLFSAHGLPERIVKKGDPYQWQVEETVRQIVAGLGQPDIDYTICYQSRVGPMKWIGPATDAEIRRAGRERKAAVVVPVAFVSEHSETLYELDILYRKLAEEAGVPAYIRVPALSRSGAFIEALKTMVIGALEQPDGGEPRSAAGHRLCPVDRGGCAMAGIEEGKPDD